MVKIEYIHMFLTLDDCSEKIKDSFYKALGVIKTRDKFELTTEDLNHIIGVVVGEIMEEGRETVEELVIRILHPLIRKELIDSVPLYEKRVQKAIETPSEPL